MGVAVAGVFSTNRSRALVQAFVDDSEIWTGATDDVIARQLGISPRTLRRRLHDLFDELGASNRFHAGVEAARRGWV